VRRSLDTAIVADATRKVDAIERGELATGGVLIRSAADAFIASCEGRGVGESTLKHYRRTVSLFASHFDGRSATTITTADIDDFRQTRSIAPGTWRKELETIRQLFAWCMDRGYLTANPAAKLRKPPVKILATAPLTHDEISAILKACDQIFTDDPGKLEWVRRRARGLVLVLLYTGLRIGDVARLRWDAISGEHLTLRTLKNGVPIKVALNAHLNKALTSFPRNDAFVFGNGTETTKKNLSRTIYRLGKIAGVRAHPHRFRDTFAVELLTTGADIRTVQLLLGHTSVRTTERHYAHFVAAHQAILDSAAGRLKF
jgi:integrase